MNTEHICADKNEFDGRPYVKGTELSLSRLLIELSEGNSLKQISENFEIDFESIEWAICPEISGLLFGKKIGTPFIDNNGSTNCLTGYRLPISMILCSFAEGEKNTADVAKDMVVKEKELIGMLRDLSSIFAVDWSDGFPE